MLRTLHRPPGVVHPASMTPPPFVPLPAASFRAAIAAVMSTILLAALEQTIVGVALPTIAAELGGFEWMAWVVSGYLIAATVVTPLYGRFSDVFGRRAVMTVSIVLFLAASAFCALAQTLPQLVLARVLQGLGGGGLIATAQALVADIVPLRERGRYQGYISVVWAVASLAGPLAGGLLTQYLSWPWIFWINLPVGLAALVLVRVSLRRLPVPAQRRAGPVGALGTVWLLVGLTALLLPITRIGQGAAVLEPGNLAGFAIGAATLALFWHHERSAAVPVLPPALWRVRPVVVCSLMQFICFFLFIALSVLLPLRMQMIGGHTAGESAARLLPLTLAIPIAAFAAGRYTYRTGRVLAPQRVGVWMVPAGMVLLALGPPQQAAAMIAGMLVLGFGVGLQLPTTLLTVQQAIPREWIGTATAFIAFFRLLGGAVGTAVLSALLLAWMRGASGVAGQEAAFRAMLFAGAAVALGGPLCVRLLPEVRLDGGAAARPVPAAAGVTGPPRP